MAAVFPAGLRAGLKSSPWIIIGSSAILLTVVAVLTIQNTHRERRYMSELLSAKGAALIRAVEAGARTGMMGMMWGGRQIQRLLEETARLPDVLYIAVVDPEGTALAHSDAAKVGLPFSIDRKLSHPGPADQERWELVDLGGQRRAFEVHRHFRPLRPGGRKPFDPTQPLMRHGMQFDPPPDDWLSSQQRRQLLIVVGLDTTPFEEAIDSDIRTSVLLAAVLLLLGFGGLVSLFWMHSYRAARQSLRDTSAFANEVVAHLPVGLIASDRTGRITFFNAAAEQVTGLKHEAALGLAQAMVLPPGLNAIQSRLDEGDAVTDLETTCTFAGGRSVPVSVSATRIHNDIGEFVGQVLIVRDLAEIRRLQEQVRRQEKLAALGGLAAGVAHEIRNPLSSIKGLATYFAGQFDAGSEARQAAGVMVQEVDRLNRVITELLDFARPTDVKRHPTDLGDLLARSLKLVQQDAANQGIDISLSVDPDLCPVPVDPDRLAQCLLNLYLNAIQAMEGGGTLSVRCSLDENRQVAVTVGDTGEGIPADRLEKIFDPYFTTKKNGTGLGLAIVHKIIEAHAGRLEVDSRPGAGTRFTLRIPRGSGGDLK